MPWTQNYDPLGALSAFVAGLPIVLLLSLLASGRVRAHWAALVGLVTAMLAAVFVFQPAEVSSPDSGGVTAWAGTVLMAAVNGAAFGLFPIGWIVLAAIFLYKLTVETGQFDVVKHSVMSLSDDRRIQALLIAFCFGAFIEGAAGFGTPVAISAALMVGAGFRPLHAAGLALIANTSPVAFGALGTPILTLAQVTGLDEMQLSAMAGRQLPFFSLLVPAWLVWTMAGWRATWQIWPALLVCGGSFAVVQFLMANFHGPRLVDVAGGVVSMVCLAAFLRVWQPRRTWRFHDEHEEVSGHGDTETGRLGDHEFGNAAKKQSEVFPASASPDHRVSVSPCPRVSLPAYTRRQVISAWMPWVFLTLFVFLWGLPSVKTFMAPAGVRFPVPALHEHIARDRPVVDARQVEKAIFEFNSLSATGTSLFLAAAVSSLWLRVGWRPFLRLFVQTTYQMRWPLFTIACMLAIAFTTRYSGMDATLGLAFTKTGYLYPLFAAMLGWLGVALTGSDTSSNALFGSMQTITARRLVADGILPLAQPQAMILLAASNSTGGVMGKMIDAQSIVVSAVATQQSGQEGAILRFVFWHSLALAILMGLLVTIQAYWWTGIIP
jgi:lactate permease